MISSELSTDEMRKLSPWERANYSVDYVVWRAAERGTLKGLFCGYGNSFGPAPDDYSMTNAGILIASVHRVYRKHPEMKDTFMATLDNMLKSGDAVYAFAALDMIRHQLAEEKNGFAAFRADRTELLAAVCHAMAHDRCALENYKNYRGQKYPDGTYGFAEEIKKQLEEPEEC